MQVIFRRLWWRLVGTPAERAENWRSKSRDRVSLRAIRSHLYRDEMRSPAALRVRALHEVISRELLDLQRARHTLAATGGNVIQLQIRKKEA